MQQILLITSLAFLFWFSHHFQPPIQADNPIDGLTEEQYAWLLQHTEPFPDSTELSIALLQGDSVTLVGIRKIAGDLQSVSNAHRLFEIGSVTKVFTAGLLSQMVIDGQLDLKQAVGITDRL